MSLQLIAKQMEAKGRNGDSVLVHMTTDEVAGLQKLAESAGGSLSVNPETGLVEANFLKRMLPTLVGLGVGAFTMNPYAGAAAGAAVGGVQAKENKQDFLTGALMGGLGGYGGAGIGSGLASAGNAAVSQAATAANPGLVGPMPGAVGGAEALKAGVAGLGETAGREAFMQGVGGLGGLTKSVSMAASPTMAPGKMPGPAPVDDEMIQYDYDVGRTYAENTPTASSGERKYFDGKYSEPRKIKARDYQYAEGGETAAPSSSDMALAYLMGERSSSGAGLPALAAQTAPTSPAANRMYTFDPTTGTYAKNPNYIDPEKKVSLTDALVAGLLSGNAETSGGGGGYEAPQDPAPVVDRIGMDDPANPNRGTVDYGGNVPSQDPTDPTFVGPQDPYSQGGGSAGQSWESLPADMRGSETSSGGDSLSSGSVSDALSNAGYSDTGGYGEGAGGFNDSYGGYGGFSDGAAADAAGGYGGYWKQGGLLGLAKGGMASGGFVVPADVVSALGNGSTDAGLRSLNAMLGKAAPIKGKGDGLSDSIKTKIDGKQPARVADGEAYIDPKTVKRVGGAKKLYAMMDKIRAQAHGKTSQQRKVNPAKVLA
jgi:hypothetical protein